MTDPSRQRLHELLALQTLGELTAGFTARRAAGSIGTTGHRPSARAASIAHGHTASVVMGPGLGSGRLSDDQHRHLVVLAAQ